MDTVEEKAITRDIYDTRIKRQSLETFMTDGFFEQDWKKRRRSESEENQMANRKGRSGINEWQMFEV